MPRLTLCLAFLFLTVFTLSAEAIAPDGWKITSKTTLPETAIRAFGAQSAFYTQYETPDARPASVLCITAESPEKAKLLHAKYLHDLNLCGLYLQNAAAKKILPGMQKKLPDPQVLYYDFPGQGCLTAAYTVRQIFLFTAANADDLKTLFATQAAVFPVQIDWHFAPETEVPLYIRARNDNPFRFYYWFNQFPEGVRPENYRFLPEFDWAKQMGTGFSDWCNVATNDNAEGLTMLPSIQWAIRAAGRRDLPVIVDTSLTDNQSANMNRFAAETMMGNPDFVGAFYCVADTSHAGIRPLSWGSQAGKSQILATLQQIVRETRHVENVVEYLEPHGELRHANSDIYLEYGPVADASFRDYLRREYNGDLSAVSRRWHDDPAALRSWDDVRVPEIASFAGWNADALDLKGDWRVQQEPPRGEPPVPEEPQSDDQVRHRNHMAKEAWERGVRAPAEWFSESFDDSAWPAIPAPGHDRIMFVHNRRPAVFRRDVTVPEDWRRKHDRVWIYVWDLNRASGHPEQVWLNGTMVGQQEIQHPRNNVMVFEVTDQLRAGKNTVAVRTAEGFLAYKVYLSPHAPQSYPLLAPTENRRWVDFAGWWRWSRIDAVRRGMEMIREEEPDKGIVCMSPYSYFAGIRELCATYGGHFHDTGGMSGTLGFSLPALMRSAGLACTLEPGGPANDPPELRRFTSLWAIEGLNSIHYFIHIGSVFWHPEIRGLFERLHTQTQFMGRHHIPKGQIASLMDDRVGNLTDFPLMGNENVFIRHDPGRWAVSGYFLQEYHWDNVTLYDFEAAEQKRLADYRVIIDTNCSILTGKQVADIERWVRDGGVFVTHVQTGRHLPDVADAWPISKLTGYRVTHIDPHDTDGKAQWRKLRFTADQPVFREADWPEHQKHANGLSLEKVAPECTDLLYWEDGTVAAGMRPLGKGYVIHLGAKFCDHVIWWGNEGFKTAFMQILQWHNMPQLPARAERVLLQHSVTNDFLHDVWTLTNHDRPDCETRITFLHDAPAELLEVCTGKRWPLTRQDEGTYTTDTISMARNETRIFTAPRAEIADSQLAWLEHQRAWWQGAWKPDADTPLLGQPAQPNTCPFNDDWAFLPLADDQQPEACTAVNFNDSAWQRGKLESWTVPEDSPSKRRVFRRTVRVPDAWRDGDVTLYYQGQYDNPYLIGGRGRFWLDGEEIQRPYRGIPLTGAKPGQTYQVTIYCEGTGDVCGPSGNIWLWRTAIPAKTFSLAGDWSTSTDALRWSADTTALPGPWPEKARFARRTFTMPAFQNSTQVYIRYTAARPGLTGVIINGRYLRRHHHDLSETTHLNITPWLRPGQPNEIEIVGREEHDQQITEIRLDFYE